jgi:hypothetical protein
MLVFVVPCDVICKQNVVFERNLLSYPKNITIVRKKIKKFAKKRNIRFKPP